ncbi:MAG: lipoate--protein ligase family protein [Spirochaetaceae bacterium]|jgi:lipoate-protein ligase A|nr:lipoate--protein ligase family protein [Spirochaetaceae bacterium]
MIGTPAAGPPPDDRPFPFRLLKTGYHNCFYNMALDEALLESVALGHSLPVLRFYGWKPRAVSVGYFQGLEDEVDLAACKARGVDVIRRITGGGAVFHHAELTYSIIMADSHPLAGDSIRVSYQTLCAGIIRGLELLGLEARFAPINDILCGGRKISGNAQTRRRGTVLHHGTILLDLDVALMFELLKVPEEKNRGRLIRDVTERVTSLKDLGVSAGFAEAEDCFAEGFRRALSLDFTEQAPAAALSPSPAYPGGPAAAEEARALELAAGKFASPEWLYKR